MTISRCFVNICSDRLPESRDYYVDVFGFEVMFDSDWFVQLTAPDGGAAAIGVMARDHELVPEPFRYPPQGCFVTIVVEDVETVFRRAGELGVPIVREPRDEFYGQRRLLLTDPNGFLVDVSSPTAPVSAEFAAQQGGTG